ncbi:morphogenic membrane protein MmpB [Streptomyces sp. NPDC127084]
MLWSDPKDEPPQELRDMEAMLRRAGVLLALVMIIGMIVVGLR